MQLTADQLSYVLERKYVGLIVGTHVLITGQRATELDEYGDPINLPVGQIAEWNVKNIPQPNEEEIERLWSILEDQYHSDPDRMDSDMHKFMRSRERQKINITINEVL